MTIFYTPSPFLKPDVNLTEAEILKWDYHTAHTDLQSVLNYGTGLRIQTLPLPQESCFNVQCVSPHLQGNA